MVAHAFNITTQRQSSHTSPNCYICTPEKTDTIFIGYYNKPSTELQE